MYNRYVPQPDGTYRRNRMPDPARPQKPKPDPPPSPAPCEPPPISCDPTPSPCESPRPLRETRHHGESRDGSSVTGFLRQLLPKNFDTADLLIVLLLLLMAGNCEEDQNTALLTLALYFFM